MLYVLMIYVCAYAKYDLSKKVFRSVAEVDTRIADIKGEGYNRLLPPTGGIVYGAVMT